MVMNKYTVQKKASTQSLYLGVACNKDKKVCASTYKTYFYQDGMNITSSYFYNE